MRDGSFLMLVMHSATVRVSSVISPTASALLSYESAEGSFSYTLAQFEYFIVS